MDKKLTLSLDQKVIEKAKILAQRNRTSLSKMIESYFESLTSNELEEGLKTTPLVESLTGVVELPNGIDYKEARMKYLLEKHK